MEAKHALVIVVLTWAGVDGAGGWSAAPSQSELAALMWHRLAELQAWHTRLDLKLDGRGPEAAKRVERPADRLDVAFRGEFGYEMVAFGFEFYHALAGGATRIVGCGHMAPFYWFARQYVENATCKRKPDTNMLSALAHAPSAELAQWRDMILDPLPLHWISPPTREYHAARLGARSAALGLPAELRTAPVVMISNKYTREFFITRRGSVALQPTNFLALDALSAIVDAAVRSGAIVLYNRPGALVPQDAEATGQQALPFADKSVLLRRAANATHPWHGRVHLVERLAPPGTEYNDILVAAMSAARCFVSVQGGTSWLSALFGGHQLVQHARGLEEERAYQYTFPLLGMARSLTVTRNGRETAAEFRELVRRGACARARRTRPRTPPPRLESKLVSRVVLASMRYRAHVDRQRKHNLSAGIYRWPAVLDAQLDEGGEQTRRAERLRRKTSMTKGHHLLMRSHHPRG